MKNLFFEKGWDKSPNFGAYAAPVRVYSASETTINDSEMLDILTENDWWNNLFLENLNSAVFDKVFGFFNVEHKNSLDKLWNISYCVATRCSHYCFTPDGNITTCLRCTGKEECRVGIFDDIKVIIDNTKLNMWKTRNPFKMDKCKECKFILLCGGGCAKSAIIKYGNINCGVCNDIEKTLEVYVKHNKNKFLKLNNK